VSSVDTSISEAFTFTLSLGKIDSTENVALMESIVVPPDESTDSYDVESK
jgi:hypothetical protein